MLIQGPAWCLSQSGWLPFGCVFPSHFSEEAMLYREKKDRLLSFQQACGKLFLLSERKSVLRWFRASSLNETQH